MSIIRAAKISMDTVVLQRHIEQAEIAPEPFASSMMEEMPDAPSATTEPATIDDAASPSAPVVDIERLVADATEEGRQRGYDEGFAAGQAAGQAAFDERLEAFDRLAAGVRTALVEGISGAEELQAEIVFAAVCKIFGAAMLSEEGAILAIKEVVSRASERDITLRVSQTDYALLVRHADRLQSLADGKIELLPDSRVSLGGCLLETEGGSLDGRLEVQIQQLKDVILNALQRRTRMEADIL